MLQLIDDQTASNYYNEIDTATGDDLQSKTVALEAWANNKKAVQARQEWDHVSKVFTDFDNYSAAEGLNDFDEESRYRYANRKFIANQTGDTPENQMFIYPSKRDEVTDKLFGKTGLSEKEAFDLFKHSVESRTASEEALRELPGVLAQGVLKRAGEGKPFDEVDSWFAFSDWKERHADKLASMPKGWETAMLDSAVKLHARTEQLMDDVAPESKRAMDTLMKFTRPEDAANLPEADRADVENLAKDFAKLTPEQRDGIYATLSYAAEAGGAGMGKGFWEKVGEGIARGGGNIYDDAAMTAQDRQARQNISFFQDLIDKPKAEPDRMQTADSIQMQRDMAQKGLEENKQRLGELRVMREIRDLAQGRIDPIKTEMDGVLGQVVQGAYDFSQSAAYTGMAMVPYVGLPAVMGALANSNYLRMLDQYPDMDADAAFDLSLAIAGPQAIAERFQAGLLLGKLPFLGKAMKKLTDARVPLPARIGLGYGAVVGLETGTELIQEAMPVVADQLAAAVREDMPEFDAGKAWGEYREQAPKIFYSMLWGGLMGGGAVGFRELERSGVYMRNLQELEMHGITGEAAQNIAAEQDAKKATTLYREAWDKRSPEDIQAGIAKRAAMLDAAQATQANPDFPTRRIEENPDGTLTHIIEKGDGSVIYRTTDPVEADMALVNITRMMERSAITGTTRGIVESLSFIDQVNQASGRGEDVQKLLLNDAPRTLLTDYEANPTEQNLDNLFATVRSQGQDINEPAELANFPVLASNQGTLVEGVFRSIIQIQDGATGDKVIRDFSQDNLKRAISEGRITMDWVRENLNQVIPLIESERITGPTLRTETDTDVIESFSDVAVAYMTGRIREEQIPAGFRGFLRRMAIIVKDIFRRSYNLKRAIAEGKVDSNFESFLADSVGLNQQARVDTARERVSNEVLTDTSATNYSIGSDMVVENGRAYSPMVRDLLQRRAAGENIPRSVIDQAISDNFPAQLVEPPKSESDLPSRATIDDAINEGQRRDQIDKSSIQPGDAVTIRQDVPAMTRKGVGVVTIKGKSGNSYDAAARISDPQFILNEKKSLEIGMGGAKGPHIAIRGKWASDQSMPSDLSEWTQVGFNPDRHSFYYDRATMKQVVGGSEAYQIGNTVFVKDAKFGDGQISDISYSISVQTTAANILADRLKIPTNLGKEYAGRQIIPIEADLTAGGGSFTQKPAQGGPAFSVIPQYYNAGVVWAAAKDGFWTGKLNLARESGAIYIGKDGKEKFMVAPYAMKQDSHISNPTVAGEKFSEVSRYIRENRITKAQEQGISDLIQKSAVKGIATATSDLKTAKAAVAKAESDLKKAEAIVKKSEKSVNKDKTEETEKALKSALKDFKTAESNLKSKKDSASEALAKKTFFEGIGRFPSSLTSKSFDTYLASLSFDQRKFLGEKLSSAEAEKLGAPPMDQIRRATLDESFAGVESLSLVSILEIDVKRLEEGLKNKTLTASAYGVTPHNSYNSLAPGKPVAFFRTPIPYSLAFPDIRAGLFGAGFKSNHGYFLKGKIPVGLPKLQKISSQMLSDWGDAQTSLRPNQAKAIVTALNQGWKTYTKPRQAGLAEFTRALRNNDAAVTLTQYSSEEVSQLLKEGKMKIYQLGDMNVWFALKRPGEGEAGDPKKDWHIVSVANNEKGAPGMLPLIMSKALAEGGTHLDCYAVKSSKYPDGLLPTLYAKSGFEATEVLPFDPQYHTEPGKMGELEKVWDSQKWNGQEKPPLVYMKWNPELHANIGTNARDDEARSELESDASKNEGGMAEGASQRIGRVAEGSPVSMGSEGQSEQGGRVSDGSSPTGTAGDARNILPRGIEQIVADLGNLNDYQLQALGLTRTEVDEAIKNYNDPNSVSYSIASQSEIDRVNRALGGMNRGPDARLAVYERAKAKLIGLMQSNQASLDDLRKGTVSFRRTQVLQALGELDAILSIFPPDLRGRVGGYTKLASIAPHDVFKDGEKVSEVSGMNGAIISAWMREGQNIGQAGQQTELPPGYTAKENLGTARADRAISDFFKKRIEMIDRELEKTLRREYDEAFRKLLDRTKPKKAKPGEKPKGIGGDIQDLFAVVRDSVDMSATDVLAHIAGLDAKIASGELTAEQEARSQVEAALVALTGDWKNADSDRRRTALTEATRIWSGAYATHTQKLIRQREEREIARAEAIIATGKDGDMPGRTSKAISDSGLKGTWKDYILNLLNFDQVVGVLFGENSEFSNTIIDKQRLAENAKEDGSQAKMQALEDFFSGLAGGDLLAGERLRYQLTQPSMTVNDIQMSQLEGLSAVMMWAQKDGRRHMEGERDENGRPSGKWNYDQAFVDEITANLSAEALALRDWLSQQYSAEYTNINAVYSELNGVNLPQIQNYSPVTVQPVNAPAGQVLDPVSGSAMSGASTSPGALRTRGTSIAEPRFQDVLQTYIAHTLQMEHWKAFAPMLAEVNGILRNRNVQNSVQEKGGIEAREMLNSWLDYFGQGGTRDAGAHLALNQGLNNVLGRASQVALVGRISTLLIQSTQLGAALAEVPAGPYLKRMGKLLSGQLSWDAALNSDYIQRRIKQMPPVVQMAMQGLKGAKPTAIQQAGKRLGMLLSGADGLFTAGTYAIVYDWHLSKAKELGLAGQQAEDYARNTAERATDRIAQPTRAGARSLYENTQTNPLARAGWAFASEARKNLALVAYSFAERDTATKLRTIAYVLAVNAIGSQILRSIWRDTQDDDDEELFDDKYWNPKRFLMAAATEPLYGIPVFGSMLEEAVYKSAGEYNPQTSLFSVASAVGPIKRLPDHLSGDTEMRDVFSDIDKIISSLGIMHPNIAATASMTHLAKDLFGLADSAVDAATED